MTTTSIAVAIIYQDGNYLMQLRDDVPHIIHPGVWGFFGGHLEPGEDPETGLKRELLEEINYQPEQVTLFRCDRALKDTAPHKAYPKGNRALKEDATKGLPACVEASSSSAFHSELVRSGKRSAFRVRRSSVIPRPTKRTRRVIARRAVAKLIALSSIAAIYITVL